MKMIFNKKLLKKVFSVAMKSDTAIDNTSYCQTRIRFDTL